MAHNHAHESCNDEGHDHDHIPEEEGHRDNLFVRIDRANVVALNAVEPGKGSEVIKPWNECLDEQMYLESDLDDQLIIRVPFVGSVKLRAVLLKAGPTDQTPAKLSLYANVDNVDFNDISDRKPVQQFDVPQGREIGEYHVLPAKFPSVTSLTLFFPASQGADTTRIYYVGFLGEWTERKNSPVITVYETQANLADHEKIQGMNGNVNMPQP